MRRPTALLAIALILLVLAPVNAFEAAAPAAEAEAAADVETSVPAGEWPAFGRGSRNPRSMLWPPGPHPT